MSLVHLFIPREVAHDTLAELGELANVQFKDASGIISSRFLKSDSSLYKAQSGRESVSTVLRWRDSANRRNGAQSPFPDFTD